MIAFRDFKAVRPAGFFPSLDRLAEAQQRALAEANEWIVRESIDLIGVESLADQEEGAPVERRCIRIWYRTAICKSNPHPEV